MRMFDGIFGRKPETNETVVQKDRQVELLTEARNRRVQFEQELVVVAKQISDLRHGRASLAAERDKWQRLQDYAVSQAAPNEETVRQAVENRMAVQTKLDEVEAQIERLKGLQKELEGLRDGMLEEAEEAHSKMVELNARMAAAEVRKDMAKDEMDGEAAQSQHGELLRLEKRVESEENLAEGYQSMTSSGTKGAIEAVDTAAQKQAVDDEVKRLLNGG